MPLAMLLLGLMKKCAWNILREALVCCSGGAFLIQRPLNKLAFRGSWKNVVLECTPLLGSKRLVSLAYTAVT